MDWKSRSEMNADVVWFLYRKETNEKMFDEVFVWDLDKTYLDTSMQTLRDLYRIAVERGLQKKNVPGTGTLLQVLGQNWQKQGKQDQVPLFFITASPPQIEERIYEKIKLDSLNPIGCYYKDNLSNLRPSRFWRLTRQVGYKLQALMQLRTRLKEEVKLVCWGDDSESDAIIYNIWSDICSRRLGAGEIRHILRSVSVIPDQIDRIFYLQSQIPANDPVDRIYINLAEDTDADYYLKFGRRTLPTYNTFQIALDLCQDGRIGLEGLFLVAQDMMLNYGYTPEELTKSFDELIRRQVLGQETVELIVDFLISRMLFPKDYAPSIAPRKIALRINNRVYAIEGVHEPWVPDRTDYLHDYR